MMNFYIHNRKYLKALYIVCFLILLIGINDSYSQINKTKPKKPIYDPEDTVKIKPGFEKQIKPGMIQLDMTIAPKIFSLSPSFDMNFFRVGINQKEEFYAGGRGGGDFYTVKEGDGNKPGSPFVDVNLMLFGKMEKRIFRFDIYTGTAFHINTGSENPAILKMFLFKAGADFRIKFYKNIAGLVIKGWYTKETVNFGIGIFAGFGFVERKY